MPTMNRYTLLPLLAALAACNAPDTFVLSAIATGDATPTDVSGDATGDAPADAARPDVAPTDVAIADAGDAADAADAQVADVVSDAAQADAPSDVALADACDAGDDAAVSDVADANDAAEASVDEICARATNCASCAAIRFDATHVCGWCGVSGACMYGTQHADRVGACAGGWYTPWNVCP